MTYMRYNHIPPIHIIPVPLSKPFRNSSAHKFLFHRVLHQTE